MTNIMLDLETLGTKPGCSILSIGAVEFDEKATYREFYVEIDRASCRELELTENAETLHWWLNQSKEARRVLCPEFPISIIEALILFQQFVRDANEPFIWGNGATFDPPILEAAYFASNSSVPWKFYNVRCFRTLKNLFKHVKSPVETAAHNALMDAKAQALHAVDIAQVHNLAFA